jgi:hypothetical protein
MDSKQETFSTPRSAMGFALAITLAMFTFWVAGLVVQLHSYSLEAPVQSAAAQVVSDRCTADDDEAVPCAPPRIDP